MYLYYSITCVFHTGSSYQLAVSFSYVDFRCKQFLTQHFTIIDISTCHKPPLVIYITLKPHITFK